MRTLFWLVYFLPLVLTIIGLWTVPTLTIMIWLGVCSLNYVIAILRGARPHLTQEEAALAEWERKLQGTRRMYHE